MFSRNRMPGLGTGQLSTNIVDPGTVSAGLAKVAAFIRSQGGADALAAKQAATLIPQPDSVNPAYAAQAAAQNAALLNPAVQVGGPDYMKLAMYAGGGLVGVYLLMKLLKSKPTPSSPSAGLPVHQNPSRVPVLTRSDRLKKAVNAYESFHWGDKPDKFVAKKISKPPKVGVKLGKLVSVAYETHKNGEHAVWEHEFGEEGGKRPDLVMDADSKRLHIVGGSYDVRPEGIID